MQGIHEITDVQTNEHWLWNQWFHEFREITICLCKQSLNLYEAIGETGIGQKIANLFNYPIKTSLQLISFTKDIINIYNEDQEDLAMCINNCICALTYNCQNADTS